MAVFYKSDSVWNRIVTGGVTAITIENNHMNSTDPNYATDGLPARPIGTMVLDQTTGFLYWSTNATIATYLGVGVTGNVNIPVGSTLTFDTTDLVLTPDGTDVIVTGTARLDLAPSVGLETDGIDFGDRLVLNEEFHQRALLNATLALPEANKSWELRGTNATDAGSTFHVGGGNTLTTGALANDQAIVWPHLGGGPAQSAFAATQWDADNELAMKVILRTGAAADITDVILGAGYKIGLVLDVGTDADQIWVGFDPAGTLTPVGGDPANFAVVLSRTGLVPADIQYDTGIAVAADTTYRITIWEQADRTVRIYIDGVLVTTTAVMSAAALTTMKPFAGVQATAGAAARAITVRRVACSMNYT